MGCPSRSIHLYPSFLSRLGSVAADKMVRAERRDIMHVTLRTLPVMSTATAIRMARSESNGCQRSDARCIDHHEAGAAARQAPWASRNFRRPPRPRTCVPRDNLRTTIGLLSQENRCCTYGQSPSGDPGLLWTSEVYMNYRGHLSCILSPTPQRSTTKPR